MGALMTSKNVSEPQKPIWLLDEFLKANWPELRPGFRQAICNLTESLITTADVQRLAQETIQKMLETERQKQAKPTL
jgi:hypothetical protein